MKPKVLISDALSDAAIKIFQDHGIDVDVKPGLKPDELRAIIGAYDGLAIRSATKVTKDLLEAATLLKVVGRAGIGVDNVDIGAATAHGVVVMNTPFGNSVTTGEHAIAMMFALARQLPLANASTHAGKWEKSRFMGVELTGKTLGVIGCGNIGSIVAERALGLKMKVVAFDPFLTNERAVRLGVEKLDLDALLARADFITLHTPMTDQTRNLINAEAIAKCKRGVYVINCARGGLVNEVDLQAALESGQVAGAALDVFAEEPAKVHPLFGNEKVICTPHLGASTSEAQENVALQVAEQMSSFLLSGAVANALNMPSISPEEAPRLHPYMALGQQLGSFAGQISGGGFTSILIDFQGEVASLNTKPIVNVILMSLLRTSLENVNMVNASVVAKDSGYKVMETRMADRSEYESSINLAVWGGETMLTITGTLFADIPYIVGLDGVDVESELRPQMLFVRNMDKPGFIGRLGTLLGDANINIASFVLGRRNAGHDAVCLVTVDDDIAPDLCEKVRKLPGVVNAYALKFSDEILGPKSAKDKHGNGMISSDPAEPGA